jgi:predicted patatin/cPLA2 family phospholipase
MLNIDTLCFSSGGLYGFLIIGCMKKLLDYKYIEMKNIKKIVGTSAGAACGLFYVLDYNYDEILKHIDLDNIMNDCSIDNLLINFGLNNGKYVRDKFSEIIYNKLKVYDITFKELYEKTNKEFCILVTNFTKSKQEILSYIETPNLSLITALQMSCCIPLIFKPILYNNNYYYDGAIICNIGLDICDPNTTLGLLIQNQVENRELENINDLLIGILGIIVNNLTCKKNCYKTIILAANGNVNLFKFDKDIINNIIQEGYEKANEFLINEYKSQIKNTHNKIIKSTLYSIINKIV